MLPSTPKQQQQLNFAAPATPPPAANNINIAKPKVQAAMQPSPATPRTPIVAAPSNSFGSTSKMNPISAVTPVKSSSMLLSASSPMSSKQQKTMATPQQEEHQQQDENVLDLDTASPSMTLATIPRLHLFQPTNLYLASKPWDKKLSLMDHAQQEMHDYYILEPLIKLRCPALMTHGQTLMDQAGPMSVHWLLHFVFFDELPTKKSNSTSSSASPSNPSLIQMLFMLHWLVSFGSWQQNVAVQRCMALLMQHLVDECMSSETIVNFLQFLKQNYATLVQQSNASKNIATQPPPASPSKNSTVSSQDHPFYILWTHCVSFVTNLMKQKRLFCVHDVDQVPDLILHITIMQETDPIQAKPIFVPDLTLQKHIHQLYNHRESSDVEIVLSHFQQQQPIIIYAHKSILASHSSFFHDYFTLHPQTRQVHMKDLCAAVQAANAQQQQPKWDTSMIQYWKQWLEYLYTYKLSLDSASAHYYIHLTHAWIYQHQHQQNANNTESWEIKMMQTCQNWIIKQELKMDTVLQLLVEFVDPYFDHCQMLKDACFPLAAKNWKYLIQGGTNRYLLTEKMSAELFRKLTLIFFDTQ